MSNTEILDEVYHRLCNMLEATDGNGTGRALKSFIEEEWQKRDEMRRHLSQMDHRLREDVGLTSADIRREVEKPFWIS